MALIPGILPNPFTVVADAVGALTGGGAKPQQSQTEDIQ